MSDPILKYSLAEETDLDLILKLQQKNLKENTAEEEVKEEGFVTLIHDKELLMKMNTPHPHIICKFGEVLAGYALVLLPDLQNEIPSLKPMFESIDIFHKENAWEGKYFIMGQICIDKSFRRMGIFKGMYNHMAHIMKPFYDKIVTEVNKENQRSLQAHLHSGFTIMMEHQSGEENWVVIERNIS